MSENKQKSALHLHIFFGLVFAASLVLVVYGIVTPKTVQATPLMIPFGGYIIRFDPGSPAPAFCPAHTQIFDYFTDNTYGIMAGPGSQIYSYGNLLESKVAVLGEHVVAPTPCARPYPLFIIHQIGTSEF